MGNQANSGTEQPAQERQAGGATNGEARERQSCASAKHSEREQSLFGIGGWSQATPGGGRGSAATGPPPARPNQSQSTPRRLGAEPSRDLVERFLSHESANVIDRLHQDAPRYPTSGDGTNGQPAGASK